MAAYGYKRKLLALEIMSALPPEADILGGVTEGPFLTHSGHWGGLISKLA